ncbi:hypothetical protein HCH_02872 [Hahella chejuensis KCTC 2396]|uniref:HTH cro/C1-type domain-containing protein n=2 Tax=Gammaproteobacteria TaxID=1236 RepID=Q2SI76_HAHCH|nr:helix-turn-helix domain-containing protein [Hahella chejuensis]ABC29648.1 hypothetical protein HCH_02872 [Hahella chejuensis KCTC 2396]
MIPELFHDDVQFDREGFKLRLRQAQDYYGYTQQQVADAIGVQRSKYAKWVLTERSELPDLGELTRLCVFYQQWPIWFLAGVQGPSRHKGQQLLQDDLFARWNSDGDFQYLVRMLMMMDAGFVKRLAGLVDDFRLGTAGGE